MRIQETGGGGFQAHYMHPADVPLNTTAVNGHLLRTAAQIVPEARLVCGDSCAMDLTMVGSNPEATAITSIEVTGMYRCRSEVCSQPGMTTEAARMLVQQVISVTN